jgi:hypothetical protein
MKTFTLTVDVNIPGVTRREAQIIKGLIRTHEVTLYTRYNVPPSGIRDPETLEKISLQLHDFIVSTFAEDADLILIGVYERDESN